jgi:peptidoglycan-N-acetylglucosamine deacetylase
MPAVCNLGAMEKKVVCFTFDFDALSIFLARGMSSPTPLSRGEFCAVGAGRILELLRRHDIKATWFVPGHTIESFPAICEQIVAGGHEIGHHGWTHVSPANMSAEEEEAGLVKANEAIKRLSGRHARGYRSPAWDLSASSVDLLLKHGFDYDSSMMGHDYLPYFVRRGDAVDIDTPLVRGEVTPLLEMPVSWSLDDFPHFEFLRSGDSILQGLKNGSGVLENWVEDFLYLKESLDWGIITYTFHPFVIGRGHRMRILERLIRRLQDEGGEFVTMERAAAAARERLIPAGPAR